MALASEKVEAPRRPQLLHPVPQLVSAFQPTIHTLPARYPSYLPLCSLVLERETHIQGRASYILNKPRLLPADRHLPVPSLGTGSCASCLVPCVSSGSTWRELRIEAFRRPRRKQEAGALIRFCSPVRRAPLSDCSHLLDPYVAGLALFGYAYSP